MFTATAFVVVLFFGGAPGFNEVREHGASIVCKSGTLPDLQATREVWKAYLNRELQRCFGDAALEIQIAGVAIDEHTIEEGSLASHLCPIGYCTIVIPKDLLAFSDPRELDFVIGHEVGHIVLYGRDYRSTPADQIEFAADHIAASRIRGGNCVGAKVLTWLYTKLQKNPQTPQEGLEELSGRIKELQRNCRPEP